MKLKINEEKGGLKLIKFENGLIIITFISGPRQSEYYYDSTLDCIEEKRIEGDFKNTHKILFATSNLGLEGVPVMEETLDFAHIFYGLLKNTYSTFDEWPEAIEYKKQPKIPEVEITFENDIPVKCVVTS